MLTRLKVQLFLETLRDAERLPAHRTLQQAAGLVNRLIGRIVDAPFWRQRLAMLVGPDETVSLNRWQEVPLLTPAEADRIGAELLTVGTAAESEILDVGASAGPFRHRNKLAVLADLCVFERVLELHNIPLSGRLVDILAQPFLFAEDWSWNTTFAKAPYEAIAFASPPQMQIEALRAEAGSVLRASPPTLRALLDTMAGGADFPKLAAVIAVGAPIADSLRRALLAHVAPVVVAIWHDPRLGIIAYSDPWGDSWRMANETQFVEVVCADGSHCRPSEPGCVAVTPLYNHSTPAIRFAPGARARSAPAQYGRQGLTELTMGEP